MLVSSVHRSHAIYQKIPVFINSIASLMFQQLGGKFLLSQKSTRYLLRLVRAMLSKELVTLLTQSDILLISLHDQ